MELNIAAFEVFTMFEVFAYILSYSSFSCASENECLSIFDLANETRIEIENNNNDNNNYENHKPKSMISYIQRYAHNDVTSLFFLIFLIDIRIQGLRYSKEVVNVVVVVAISRSCSRHWCLQFITFVKFRVCLSMFSIFFIQKSEFDWK